jgi:hypothetical protein
MKRIAFVLAMAAYLALSVAATVEAKGTSFHFTVSGPGAEAFWSDFPFEGTVVPNHVYTDVFIFAADNTVTADGETFNDRFMFFDVFRYKFDQHGNFLWVSDTGGFGGGSDVSFSVDARNLTSATLNGTATDVTVCTPGPRKGQVTCKAASATSVSASWTGTGELVRSSSSGHFKFGDFIDNSHSRGATRGAQATGQLGSTNLGTSLGADIFNSSFTDVSICHDC